MADEKLEARIATLEYAFVALCSELSRSAGFHTSAVTRRLQELQEENRGSALAEALHALRTALALSSPR